MKKMFALIVCVFVVAACNTMEGVGKDINLIVGNGYAKGHAELTLNIIRESKEIRDLFSKLYV